MDDSSASDEMENDYDINEDNDDGVTSKDPVRNENNVKQLSVIGVKEVKNGYNSPKFEWILDRVLDKVFTYVKDDLNVENVLSIRDLWMSCDKMEEVKICDQFIEKNLNDISKLQIFKMIEFNYLKLLMKSNNLVVLDEKRIYEIAIEWLNVDIQTRQQFGQQLMENVRLWKALNIQLKKQFRIGQNILTSVDITPRRYGNVFDYIILIGGYGAEQSCTKYDPKNKTFIELEPLPDRRNRKSSLEIRDGSTGCSVNNKFYVFGGGYLNSCEYYCPQEDTWRPLLKMKEERCKAGSCYDNNKFIYVVGGYNRNFSDFTSMERFDVEIGQWLTLKSSIGVGRWGLTLTMFKNQIILIGGNDYNNTYNTIQKYDSIRDSSNSCEYYCPQEDTWRHLLKMKGERCLAGSCYDNNKFIYVVGGRDLKNNIYLTSMERFDVEIGQWLTLKSSIGVGLQGLTLTMFKNQIILIGGTDKNRKNYNTIQKYDSISDSWSQIGILNGARADH
ncbi:Kelch-like protein 12 [Nymphon striatum]|nr:Kelch-like protein 12 [Nymphon striatum]